MMNYPADHGHDLCVRVMDFDGDEGVWTSKGYLTLPGTYEAIRIIDEDEPDWPEILADESDNLNLEIIYNKEVIRVQNIDFEWSSADGTWD